MVKMEICSDSEDQQIFKLNEYSLIAYKIWKAGRDARLGFGKFKSKKSIPSDGAGAKAYRPASKEDSSATNGSSEPLAHDHHEALLVLSSPTPKSSLRKQEVNAGLASADRAALNKSGRPQAPSKGAKAATAKSDGKSREGLPQRSPSPFSHREEQARSAKEAARAPRNPSLS